MQRRELLIGLALGAGLRPSRLHATVADASTRADDGNNPPGNDLLRILDQRRDWLGPVWAQPERHQLQLLYTRIERDRDGRPLFRNFSWRLDRGRYFWPASLVKLPMAAFALEQIRALALPGVDRDTALFLEHGPDCRMPDPDAGDSIARSVWRSLIVSENPAYSRLFDVVGPAYAGHRLAAMGHADARIVARFVPCTRDENRSLAGLRFESDQGLLLARQPPREVPAPALQTAIDASVAAAFRQDDGSLTSGPTDFSYRNFLPLEAAHRMLMAVIFPAAMPRHERFDLPPRDLDLLRAALSTRPADSRDPIYDQTDYPDSYARLFGWGAGRRPLPRSITVHSKIGEAWGFLSECAYIVDHEHGVEFMLSGVGYFNADGVLNDDRYEYTTLGYPFFERVGQVLLAHERTRRRRGRFDPARPWYDG